MSGLTPFLSFKTLKHVLKMSEDDPRRMEEFRKYASIYGRFDCKRKPEKPLSSHEVSYRTFLNFDNNQNLIKI